MRPAQKLILLVLASFSDTNNGTCWPNIKQIAKKTGYTDDTVSRWLNAAMKEGWFDRWSIPRAEGTGGISYGYQLTLKDP